MIKIPFWRRAILRLLRVTVSYGTVADHLQYKSPVIVTCNHRSLLDGVILALASPCPMVFPVTPKHSVHNRFTRFGLLAMEKAGLGKVEVMNSDSPLSLRTLAQALEDGRSVAIFPEGRITRPDEVVQLKPGVGWLAKKTGATVVQAELIGAENSRWFSPAGSILWPKITLLF